MFRPRFNRSLLILCVGVAAFAYSGCARSPQAKRDKYLAAGKQFLGKKNYRRAILEFQNAVQAMPADAEAHYELGLAQAESGDAQHGYNNLKRAVELNPRHQQAQLKLAQLRAAARDPEVVREGQDELKKLAASSTAPDVLNALAVTQLRLGETGDGMQSLEEALKNSPQELSSSIMLARAKLAQKDASGAEEVLKKACESAPKSADPHIVLGEFYAGQRRGPEAEDEFQKVLGIDPKRYRALFDLAQVQFAAGEKQQAEQNFKRLAASGEKSFKPIHAIFLFSNGQRNEAIVEFERLFQQDPNDRPARTRLVAAYEAEHRTFDAEKVLAQALKKNSRDVDALSQRAALSQASGKYADAEKDLNEALHLQPDLAEARYTLFKVHEAEGQPLRARQDLSEAVRVSPNFLPARVDLAALLSAGKDNKAALDLLDRAPAGQKQSLLWLAQRNWVLWASGDMAEMRKGIDQGFARTKTPDLLIQDGLWKLQAGNFPAGRAALEEALKIAPADVRALEVLDRSYEAKKEASVGLVKVVEYASQQPKSAPMQEYLGVMLLKNGNRDQARTAFNAAKAADPKFVRADFSLVQLDIIEKKWDDAGNRLKTMLAADDGNSMAHLWLGMIGEATGNRASALDQYRKSVAIDAQNVEALNNLAYLLADYANKPDEALPYAQKAHELDPGNPHTADTLGWIYYRKGMYSSAITQMEAGAAQDQGNAVIKYHLAMAYAKSGDAEKGLATLQAALKLNPKLPEAQMAASVVAEPQ